MDKKRSGLGWFCHRYLIDALSAMAYGLFASLIIGVIFSQLGKIPGMSFLALYDDVLSASSPVIGCAIGLAVAYSLDARKLALYSCAGVGALAYQLGGPVACYVASVFGAEAGNLITGRTGVDIVSVPFAVLLVGGLVAKLIGAPISSFMAFLGSVINHATQLRPVLMGIVISVLMGIFLTAPISSAAIAISLQLSGLAAGAATVGCCVHMLGFAIASFQENGWGGFFAQGIGTSMLQVPNILEHPLILVPPVVVSALLGPLATTIMTIENTPWGAGMGTSGLVGVFGAFTAMTQAGQTQAAAMLKIFGLLIAAPLILTLAVSTLMRKQKWIKPGQMKLK